MNKCTTCFFYRLKPSSINYNLSKCIKYNTFIDIASTDKTKCGPTAKDYIPVNLPKRDMTPVLDCHI